MAHLKNAYPGQQKRFLRQPGLSHSLVEIPRGIIYIYIFQYQIPHDSSPKKQNMNRGSTKPGILGGYCHVFSSEELISIGVRRVWLHPLPDRTIMQNIEFCLKTHGES